MTSKATQTLTTGMKILGGRNVPTYTLQFLTQSGNHAEGSYVTIAVPYAKLGRSSSCTVQFGEESSTVSRLHAAIERKGEEVYILNLSDTNPTLVNGRPVNEKYFLNNGDEIQLSVEGPCIRFNKTDSGTVKMGFTKRMNLVMQQSVKPYKTAAISILVVLIVIITGAGFMVFNLSKQLESQKLLTAQMAKHTQAKLAEYQVRSDSLSKNLEIYKKKSDSLLAFKNGGISYAELIKPLEKYVLAIIYTKVNIKINGKNNMYDKKDRLMCTGFMLEGGIFVTARHCIDAALTSDIAANFIQHNGGEVTYYFTALSYDRSIAFNFTNRQLTADYSMDKIVTKQIKIGKKIYKGKIRIPDYFHGADWAYLQTSFSGGVPYNKRLSANLRSGTELLVLGYSYGMRYRTGGNLEPYFSTALVTISGLQGGAIHITEAGFDGGNSGGPVFVVDRSGKAVAIGLVTGKYLKAEQTSEGETVMIDANVQILTPLVHIKL